MHALYSPTCINHHRTHACVCSIRPGLERRDPTSSFFGPTRAVCASLGRSTAVRRGFDGDDRSACLTLPIMCYSCLSASTRQSMHDARMHRRVLYKSPCALPPILGFQPAPKLSAALRRCPFSRVAAGICPANPLPRTTPGVALPPHHARIDCTCMARDSPRPLRFPPFPPSAFRYLSLTPRPRQSFVVVRKRLQTRVPLLAYAVATPHPLHTVACSRPSPSPASPLPATAPRPPPSNHVGPCDDEWQGVGRASRRTVEQGPRLGWHWPLV